MRRLVEQAKGSITWTITVRRVMRMIKKPYVKFAISGYHQAQIEMGIFNFDKENDYS